MPSLCELRHTDHLTNYRGGRVGAQVTLHDLRGSQAVLLSTPLFSKPQEPTCVDLQAVLPLPSLCLPLSSGKEALTAGIEQLAGRRDATAVPEQQTRLFGPALQVYT